jgi:hypothetical protein
LSKLLPTTFFHAASLFSNRFFSNGCDAALLLLLGFGKTKKVREFWSLIFLFEEIPQIQHIFVIGIFRDYLQHRNKVNKILPLTTALSSATRAISYSQRNFRQAK